VALLTVCQFRFNAAKKKKTLTWALEIEKFEIETEKTCLMDVLVVDVKALKHVLLIPPWTTMMR